MFSPEFRGAWGRWVTSMRKDRVRSFVFCDVFTDQQTLDDYFFRAAWYLKQHLRRGSRVYFRAPGLQTPAEVPDYLGAELKEIARTLGDTLVIESSSRSAPVADPVVYLNNGGSVSRSRRFLNRALRRPVLAVNHDSNQYASSIWLYCSSNHGQGTEQQRVVSQRRFRELAESLATNVAFVFGTGPSFDRIDLSALPPGLRIATNSMVVNDQVMEQLAPRIIIASDPIFHAGPSKYAFALRQKILSALERYDAWFIFPMRDIGVYSEHFPAHLQERLIGVPLTVPGPVNYRLLEQFSVATTSNVMTLLLLPVAASLAKTLVLGGFDGRPIEQNSYFWEHSSTVQLTGEMQSIRRAHPAFFHIDYDDYYLKHVYALQRYLDDLNKAGYSVVSLTDSHIPAVKARFAGGRLPANESALPAVSVIMPNHNSGGLIDEAIESVLVQTEKRLELIIVDDGSTDESLPLARMRADANPAIRLIECTHSGVSAARNRGLAEARGRWIAFLDSDDVLVGEESLSARIRALEGAPAFDICAGSVAMTDEQGRDVGRQIRPRARDFRSWLSGMHINGVLGYAWVLKQASFPEALRYGEDWSYLAELTRRGYRVFPVETVVATYRLREGSATQARMRQHVLSVIGALRELTKDGAGGFYPRLNRPGLSAVAVEREVNCRYMQLLVHSVLLDKPVKDIADLLAARLELGGQISHCGGSISAIAVRAYRNGVRSQERGPGE